MTVMPRAVDKAENAETQAKLISETLAGFVHGLSPAAIPAHVRERAKHLILDATGIALASGRYDFAHKAMTAIAGLGGEGCVPVIGLPARLPPRDAALINGILVHGLDFDDTHSGGIIHATASMWPTVMATSYMRGASGADLVTAYVAGIESAIRLAAVGSGPFHQLGFHPTGLIGVFGCTLAAGTLMGLSPQALVSGQGIALSMASGSMEFLEDGVWTKRMHPGWAAQSGYRAARLAVGGFLGPRTVFEGTHGLFHGFARDPACDWSRLLGGFGEEWIMRTIAFKPYPCGTMAHPYIDCALRLRAAGLAAERVASILCETAEGFVHRLWEPIAAKRLPPNGYAAKFSIPYAVATALIHGEAGLSAFGDDAVSNEAVRTLSAKVGYVIDPDHPYPRSYTGHVRVTLDDGQVLEERQPHLRGGVAEPLTGSEIDAKFHANALHGGWDRSRADGAVTWVRKLFDAGEVDLSPWRG